jgi:hypothetical protein
VDELYGRLNSGRPTGGNPPTTFPVSSNGAVPGQRYAINVVMITIITFLDIEISQHSFFSSFLLCPPSVSASEKNLRSLSS